MTAQIAGVALAARCRSRLRILARRVLVSGVVAPLAAGATRFIMTQPGRLSRCPAQFPGKIGLTGVA
jgi:hypothetical protein